MCRGVFAAIPSHPFDVVKTCMQGDLKKETYKSFSSTFAYLYKEVGPYSYQAACVHRSYLCF
jgi:hypothetical protein